MRRIQSYNIHYIPDIRVFNQSIIFYICKNLTEIAHMPQLTKEIGRVAFTFLSCHVLKTGLFQPNVEVPCDQDRLKCGLD